MRGKKMVDTIVRNDEVVGSIPTSSIMFSVTYSGRLIGSCPILSQKSELAGSLPQLP